MPRMSGLYTRSIDESYLWRVIMSLCFQGGVYVLHIFDNYGAAGWCLLAVGFFQCIGIAWIFGINKYWDRVCEMIGYHPIPWFKYCWLIVTPVATMV